MDAEARRVEEQMQAAVRLLLRTALRLLQADPHQWSTRPCPTCQAISAVLGEPFGCTLEAQCGR